MTSYCHCDPSIKNLRVYYNHDEDFDMLEPQHAFKREGKLRKDPQWKALHHQIYVHSLHSSATCTFEGHETVFSV